MSWQADIKMAEISFRSGGCLEPSAMCVGFGEVKRERVLRGNTSGKSSSVRKNWLSAGGNGEQAMGTFPTTMRARKGR